MRKILVEPAKTGRGVCKHCRKAIQEGSLRAYIVDARAFNQQIRKSGTGHEGAYRGYVETEHGCISILKYYVHLNCYRPIQKHPYSREWFDTKKCSKPPHKAAFEVWLQSKQGSVSKADEDDSRTKSKKPSKKSKDDDDDEDKSTRKKVIRKKIAKKSE